ncbi:MAG: ATP synthase F1 subunit epsilon [Cyanobacteria bacterium SIG29]|nr:ATP synthase F1 subunit epsilon [Cyanobacteria bacterium SIG29]
MSELKIHLKIITPERIVFEDDVDSIVAQGVKGSFGVYPNHIPFMSALAVDTAKAVKNGEEIVFSIIGGAFQFKNNEAIILTEVAEKGSDIDTARAELAKERAEAKLVDAETQRDIKLANMAIAKAMARLKAASKR